VVVPRAQPVSQQAASVGGTEHALAEAPLGLAKFCQEEPLNLDEAAEACRVLASPYCVVTPSPMYDVPRSSVMAFEKADAAISMAPAAARPQEHDSLEALCWAFGISPGSFACQAIEEVPAAVAPEDSSSERVALCRDVALGADEAGMAELQACPMPSPLMTPSPTYEWPGQAVCTASSLEVRLPPLETASRCRAGSRASTSCASDSGTISPANSDEGDRSPFDTLDFDELASQEPEECSAGFLAPTPSPVPLGGRWSLPLSFVGTSHCAEAAGAIDKTPPAPASEPMFLPAAFVLGPEPRTAAPTQPAGQDLRLRLADVLPPPPPAWPAPDVDIIAKLSQQAPW